MTGKVVFLQSISSENVYQHSYKGVNIHHHINKSSGQLRFVLKMFINFQSIIYLSLITKFLDLTVNLTNTFLFQNRGRLSDIKPGEELDSR